MKSASNTDPSEADTRANFIDPALVSAGWNSNQIIREYYFTDGRKLAGNQRGSRCFVDYLLYKNNQHLAIIEAKKQSSHPTQGLQQAINYAEKLNRPEILEAEFSVKANEMFHLISEQVKQELGGLDSKVIFERWEDWLKKELRK